MARRLCRHFLLGGGPLPSSARLRETSASRYSSLVAVRRVGAALWASPPHGCALNPLPSAPIDAATARVRNAPFTHSLAAATRFAPLPSLSASYALPLVGAPCPLALPATRPLAARVHAAPAMRPLAPLLPVCTPHPLRAHWRRCCPCARHTRYAPIGVAAARVHATPATASRHRRCPRALCTHAATARVRAASVSAHWYRARVRTLSPLTLLPPVCAPQRHSPVAFPPPCAHLTRPLWLLLPVYSRIPIVGIVATPLGVVVAWARLAIRSPAQLPLRRGWPSAVAVASARSHKAQTSPRFRFREGLGCRTRRPFHEQLMNDLSFRWRVALRSSGSARYRAPVSFPPFFFAS
ncbi:hypothetical protein DFH06DRAFT_1343990 [Mycena polygramma]|nr:hypothetical protein DFH06DRAFT_1343990 [Mycena polygramma]